MAQNIIRSINCGRKRSTLSFRSTIVPRAKRSSQSSPPPDCNLTLKSHQNCAKCNFKSSSTVRTRTRNSFYLNRALLAKVLRRFYFANNQVKPTEQLRINQRIPKISFWELEAANQVQIMKINSKKV